MASPLLPFFGFEDFDYSLPPQAVVSPPSASSSGSVLDYVVRDLPLYNTDSSTSTQDTESSTLDSSNTGSLTHDEYQSCGESDGYECSLGLFNSSPESFPPLDLSASIPYSAEPGDGFDNVTDGEATLHTPYTNSPTASTGGGLEDHQYQWISEFFELTEAEDHLSVSSSSSTTPSMTISDEELLRPYSEEEAREAALCLRIECVLECYAAACHPQPEVPDVEYDDTATLSQNDGFGSQLFSGDLENSSLESTATPSPAGLDEGTAVGGDVLYHSSTLSGNDDTLDRSGSLTYDVALENSSLGDSTFSQTLPFLGGSCTSTLFNGTLLSSNFSGISTGYALSNGTNASYASGSGASHIHSGIMNTVHSSPPVLGASCGQHIGLHYMQPSLSLAEPFPSEAPPMSSSELALIASNPSIFNVYAFLRHQRFQQELGNPSEGPTMPEQANPPSPVPPKSCGSQHNDAADSDRTRTPCIIKWKLDPPKKTSTTEGAKEKRKRVTDENTAGHDDSQAGAGPSQPKPKRRKSASSSSTYGVYCPHPAKYDSSKRCDQWIAEGPKKLLEHIEHVHGLPPTFDDANGKVKVRCPLYTTKDSRAICNEEMEESSLERHARCGAHELETHRLGQEFETSDQRIALPKVECPYCGRKFTPGRTDSVRRHINASCKKKPPHWEAEWRDRKEGLSTGSPL